MEAFIKKEFEEFEKFYEKYVVEDQPVWYENWRDTFFGRFSQIYYDCNRIEQEGEFIERMTALLQEMGIKPSQQIVIPPAILDAIRAHEEIDRAITNLFDAWFPNLPAWINREDALDVITTEIGVQVEEMEAEPDAYNGRYDTRELVHKFNILLAPLDGFEEDVAKLFSASYRDYLVAND